METLITPNSGSPLRVGTWRRNSLRRWSVEESIHMPEFGTLPQKRLPPDSRDQEERREGRVPGQTPAAIASGADSGRGPGRPSTHLRWVHQCCGTCHRHWTQREEWGPVRRETRAGSPRAAPRTPNLAIK